MFHVEHCVASRTIDLPRGDRLQLGKRMFHVEHTLAKNMGQQKSFGAKGIMAGEGEAGMARGSLKEICVRSTILSDSDLHKCITFYCHSGILDEVDSVCLAQA